MSAAPATLCVRLLLVAVAFLLPTNPAVAGEASAASFSRALGTSCRAHDHYRPAVRTTHADNTRAGVLRSYNPPKVSRSRVRVSGAVLATKGPDETVSVFHGSVDDAARIRQGGLDPDRAPTWASRDRRAAEDAIDPAVRGRAGRDPGIIESRVPRGIFDDLFAPAERGYRGLFPYRLRGSSEIVMRSRQQIEAFNRHRVS